MEAASENHEQGQEPPKRKRGRPAHFERMLIRELEPLGDGFFSQKTVRGKQNHLFAKVATKRLSALPDGERRFAWLLSRPTILAQLGRLNPADCLRLAERLTAASPRPTAKAAVAFIRSAVARPDGAARGKPKADIHDLAWLLIGTTLGYLDQHGDMAGDDVLTAVQVAYERLQRGFGRDD